MSAVRAEDEVAEKGDLSEETEVEPVTDTEVERLVLEFILIWEREECVYTGSRRLLVGSAKRRCRKIVVKCDLANCKCKKSREEQ